MLLTDSLLTGSKYLNNGWKREKIQRDKNIRGIKLICDSENFDFFKTSEDKTKSGGYHPQ